MSALVEGLDWVRFAAHPSHHVSVGALGPVSSFTSVRVLSEGEPSFTTCPIHEDHPEEFGQIR